MNKILALILAFVLFQNCELAYKETPNGFLYKIHQKGNGKQVAYGDYVSVWFSISTGDSIIFETTNPKGKESLLKDPAKQRAKIKNPVLDVLPYMSVGDSATVVVEIDDLMRLTKDLNDVEKLYYSVVVKSMKTREEKNVEDELTASRRKAEKGKQLSDRVEDLQAHPKGGVNYHRLRSSIFNYSKNPDLKKTNSELEYIVFKQGNPEYCQTGEKVTVHYIGMQEDGLVFDETYAYDEPFSFTLNKGRVIKAWDEGIQLLGVNGEAFFKVPPSLGYGATGSGSLIKPNATIYFYVTVLAKK